MRTHHSNHPHMLIWYQRRVDNQGNQRWYRHVEGFSRRAEALDAMLSRWASGAPARVEYLTRWSADGLGSRLTDEWRLVEALGDESAEDAWMDGRAEAAARRRARVRRR